MLNDTPSLPARCAALSLIASTLFLGFLSARALPGGKERTGEQIFRQTCVRCHGANGEGTKQYNKRLTGSRSAGELATFILKSMPPGPKRILTARDARSVADYIYNAFYSPLAQARNKPARIELSHLTVRQYRSVLADLIGSFRPVVRLDDKRGLRGEYFKTGRFRGGERILERVDPEVRFDFGTAGALPEQDDPYQFAMRWEGSVLATDTGEYEFIVRTEHSVRLWVNDLKQPLIDAYVKSGTDNEYHASIFLLGGRAYPLKLDFQKGVNGVDDLSRLKKKPAQKASLALEWRQPKRITEVIPQRNLAPALVPESYVAATPFPPDDRSVGYERGSSVSKAWDEGTTQGAIEVAAYVAAHIDELAGLAAPGRRFEPTSGNPSDLNRENRPEAQPPADRQARIREFCRRFVSRAFRRPVSPELEARFIESQLKSAADVETALKRVVLLALKSPRFLYLEAGSRAPDSYDAASRLAFALWDSLPDEELLKAAAAGQLSTRDQVARQAERMASDPRAWSKLRDFLVKWLKIEQYPDLAKDPKRYPEFDQIVAFDLRTSMEIFLEQVVRSDKSDFRELLLTDKLFLNGRLAKVYGADLPPDSSFQLISLDSTERAGVLTHPYLLASFAYLDSSSPIHRGVLIARNLLGRALRPPPQAFTPTPAALHPGMTTRQRVALQTQPPACMSCHRMINPLGFTLEKFDAIGRLRAQENGQPVDARGSYQSRDGKIVRFQGVRDLARFMTESDDAQGAFVEKLFQHLIKQPIQAYGPQALPNLQKSFVAHQFNIRKQMAETATLAALRR